MAVYRQVHVSFWQDPYVLELTPEQKYFYLYLLTNSKTRQCGCYEIAKRLMSIETGYNSETIDKLLCIFIEQGKIEYNEATNEVLLRNWHKHNSSESPKVKACVQKEVSQIKYLPFKRYCIDTLLYSMDTDPQKEKEKEKEKGSSEKFTDDSLEMKMTKYMIEKIVESYPPAKVPDTPTKLHKWCLAFDRLIRIDGRSREEIREVMKWVYQDDFWCTNIRSPDKLREKWDTLWLQMQGQAKKKGDVQKLKPGQKVGESDADYVRRMREKSLKEQEEG